MIKYGEPYEKMRGLARLSDETLSKVTRQAFWLGFAGIGIAVILLIANWLLELALVGIAALALGWLTLTFAGEAQYRRRVTWRPIIEPLVISDIIRTVTTSDMHPSEATTNYHVSFAESSKAAHEVLGTFDTAIKVGDRVLGDIWPYGGQVRNLTKVDAPA